MGKVLFQNEFSMRKIIKYYLIVGLIIFLVSIIGRHLLPKNDQSTEVLLDTFEEQTNNETITSLIDVVKEINDMDE